MQYPYPLQRIFCLLAILFCVLRSGDLVAQDQTYYHSDFEADNGGLVGTGSWQWGLVQSGTNTVHSGSLCWGTNLQGPYPGFSNVFLDTPEIDLRQASSAQLTFWHWYEFEADGSTLVDGGNVKISVDGGPFEVITPFRDYDGLLDRTFGPLNREPAFSGLEAGKQWQQARFNLQKYVGTKIVVRFHMGSDTSVHYAGWFIDDVAITENSPRDAAIWSIEAPLEELDFFLSPFVPRATVYNAGSESMSFETTVKIVRDNQQEYFSTIQVRELRSDERTTIDFDPWTASESGSFLVQIYASLSGDAEKLNDSLQVGVHVVARLFSDVTERAGLASLGGDSSFAMAWGDYNNDGFLDLYAGQQQLVKNMSDGTFIPDMALPQTWNHNPGAYSFSGYPAAWGDFDNDGDADLFVPRMWNRYPTLSGNLLRNEGSHFVDVTSDAGFKPEPGLIQNVTWLDYDNDGYLDLYVGIARSSTNGGSNQLYHNQGDGSFKEVASTLGVNYIDINSMTIFDYDNDGLTDWLLYGFGDQEDILLHNEGNGIFSQRTAEANVSGRGTIGATLGDFNNDGLLDLYVVRWQGSDGLYLNRGNGTFHDLQKPNNIPDLVYSHPRSGDYDNDGYLDLLINVPESLSASGLMLFLNDAGSGNFTKVVVQNDGWAGTNSHRLSVADYDNNGTIDIFYPRLDYRDDGRTDFTPFLLRNNEHAHNWIAIRLRGTSSNRSGIGARVRVVAAGTKQVREIWGGSSLHSPGVPIANFGLGIASIVDTVEVRWPGGIAVDVLTNVEPNQYITIEEGNGVISSVQSDLATTVPEDYAFVRNYPNPFNAGTTVQYRVFDAGLIVIAIYNQLGQKVRTLVNAYENRGTFVVNWDGKDYGGKAVASGLYYIRMENGMKMISNRMILVR